MLPSILEVAEQHGVVIDSKTYGRKETLAKCPFCHEDSKPHKQKRFYLSLNTEAQVFKCWFCGESGGVFRFISLLEGVPEAEVVKRYYGGRKVSGKHEAETLTTRQYRLLGYTRRPDWFSLEERDREFAARAKNLIRQEWNEFVRKEIERARKLLEFGIRSGEKEKVIRLIEKRERETGISILKPVLNSFKTPRRAG